MMIKKYKKSHKKISKTSDISYSKNQCTFTTCICPPPPPLAPDPGTLAHRNHAHMLPALVEIFLSH